MNEEEKKPPLVHVQLKVPNILHLQIKKEQLQREIDGKKIAMKALYCELIEKGLKAL